MYFTRSELKLIISGLHREREALREEILSDEAVGNLMDDGEYSRLVHLQDRIIDALERMPY